MLEQFVQNGFLELPQMFDADAARDLYARLMALQPYDASIFMSEDEWEAGTKSHRFTNPGPGNNVLEVLPGAEDFVRGNDALQRLMTELLGEGFTWMFGRFICRLPRSALPEWLKLKIAGKPANTLGAFMYPQYRGMTYLLHDDLHQDVQDWARMPAEVRDHRFVTLYVYLNDVSEKEAPLIVLPGSQAFGATPYQHQVVAKDGAWEYSDGRGHSMMCGLKALTGSAGYAAIWHPCLLHGSNRAPDDGHMRIALRYTLARGGAGVMDAMNAGIEGPLYLEADFTPGQNANADGTWNLRVSDFMRGAT